MTPEPLIRCLVAHITAPSRSTVFPLTPTQIVKLQDLGVWWILPDPGDEREADLEQTYEADVRRWERRE